MPDYSSLRNRLLSYWKFDNTNGGFAITPPGGTVPIPIPKQWDYGSKRFHITWLGYACEQLISPPIAAAKLGDGIRALTTGSGCNGQITQLANYGAAVVAKPVTFGGWFKFAVDGPVYPPVPYSIFSFEGKLLFWTSGQTVSLIFQDSAAATGTVATTGVSLNEWHFILASISSDNILRLRIDNGTPVVQQFPALIADVPGRVEFSNNYNWVDDSFIYDRLLTAEEEEWLWNDGAGLPFDSFGVIDENAGCQTEPCCDEDPLTYSSASASENESCCPELVCPTSQWIAKFTPPAGACVSFPTFVSISTAAPNGTIRYTTDGSEPTETSTIYSAPFEVTGPQTNVKAKVYVEGCAPSATFTTQYASCSPTVDFKFRCVNPADDNVGRWGVFTPDGVQDYRWTATITSSANFNVKRFEIWETNSEGIWNTGQGWSTQQFNTTPSGLQNFSTFPLGVFDPAQLNNAYTTDFSASFGTFLAGTHTIELYGEQQVALTGYFLFILTLSTGEVYKMTDANVCDPPPPPCPNPPTPTLVSTCTSIDVTWATAVGGLYRIYRYSPDCGPTTPVVVAAGTVTSNPQTFSDTSAVAGCTYCYYVSYKGAACPNYVDSASACAQKLPPPSVSISASHDIVCSGTSVTISWSSLNIAAGGACGSSNVSITGGIGAKPGNQPGSQVVVVNSTTTFTITGCNTCGNASDQVTVTVATDCSIPSSAVLRVQNYNENTGFHWVCSASSDFPGRVLRFSEFGFNGTIPKINDVGFTDCRFGVFFGEPVRLYFRVRWQSSQCRWMFEIAEACFGVAEVILEAFNANGDPTDPSGTYTVAQGNDCYYCANPSSVRLFEPSGALQLVLET